MVLSEKEKEVNARFIKCYHILVSENKVKTKKEFMQSLGKREQVFTRFANNEAKMSISILDLLSSKFAVSKHWVLTGEGEMFEDKQEWLIDDLQERHWFVLRQEIKDMNEIPDDVKSAYIDLYDKYKLILERMLKAKNVAKSK